MGGAAKVKIVEVVDPNARLPYPHSLSEVLSDSLSSFESWTISDLSYNTHSMQHKVLFYLFCFCLHCFCLSMFAYIEGIYLGVALTQLLCINVGCSGGYIKVG